MRTKTEVTKRFRDAIAKLDNMDRDKDSNYIAGYIAALSWVIEYSK